MSSTYSTSLRAELIGPGDQAGAWGSTTNGNLSNVFDVAIAGYQTVSVTAASQALSYVNGPTTTANLNQSVYAMLRFTTTTGAAFNVYAPPVSKQYIVYNNSGYSMTIYNSTVIGNTTAAGTGITVVNGDKIMVWSDGTNFYDLQAQNLTGTLAINKGGTGQTTANAAFNALAPSQTGANGRYLKSDGTNTSWDQINISTSDITGTLPVANGGTGVTTSTGSGNTVLSTSPTLVTPILGTPQSGTLSSCTGLPLTTGVTGTLPVANGGTGVTSSTGSGSNVLSTSPSLTTPILGTPQSGNLSNCTFPTLNQNTTGTAGGLSGQPLITVNDINCFRPGSPSTGVIFLGNTGAYLYFDGSSYQMPSYSLSVGGSITAGGNVTAYSDERLKTNWRDLPADFIEQLAKVKHGVYDRTDQEMTQVGVSAQSLQPVMPNAVIEDDGKLSVAYGNAALVAAIKLAERVVALEAKLAELTKE